MNRSDWRRADKFHNPEVVGRYLVRCKGYQKEYTREDGTTYTLRCTAAVQIAKYRERSNDSDGQGSFKWWANKHVKVKNITHWMPLPELPNV